MGMGEEDSEDHRNHVKGMEVSVDFSVQCSLEDFSGFWPWRVACQISVPQSGMNLHPPSQECRVFTTDSQESLEGSEMVFSSGNQTAFGVL